MTGKPGLNRRGFALATAAMPMALASGKVAAQVPAIPPPQGGAGSAGYIKPDSISTVVAKLAVEPFASPIIFERRHLPIKLKPFALTQVRLGEGPFRAAQGWNAGYMKRLSVDRLLHTFRVNAGITSDARPLGGWEEPTGELRGHFTGHYLSACALGYASAGDTGLKQRGDALVTGLAECQAKLNQGGYLSAYPTEFYDRLDKHAVYVWAPFYTMHKMMAGLHDMHTLAGNVQALQVLLGMAGWVDGWTASKSEEHMQQAILEVEFGGMQETLYNLADTTGDDRWAKVGDRFTKKRVFNPLASAQDRLAGLHMNTHVPQIIGAAKRYELSSDHRFHDVAQFFWNTVTANRTYVTGGSSNRENWLSNPSRLSDEFVQASSHQECCCSYNMLKLTRHLFGWNPDTRFMDYYERNLFNHRLGTIEAGTGLSQYFLALTPGSYRIMGGEDDTFWCCNGSAVEEFNKLSDTIYFHDGRNVWVNLFLDSSLDWNDRGVRIAQHTKFPQEAKTRLVVEKAPADSWALNVRIPGWTSDAAQVLINGKPLDVGATPGSYLRIARKWKKGDEVVLEMPMTLRTESFADDRSWQAVVVGPIVLAGQFPKGDIPTTPTKQHGPDLQQNPFAVPELAIGAKAPHEWLKPEAAPLTCRTVGIGQDIVLKPISECQERYAVYWKAV
jgi:uncharacterized protein